METEGSGCMGADGIGLRNLYFYIKFITICKDAEKIEKYIHANCPSFSLFLK